jgi:hypothetical protein
MNFIFRWFRKKILSTVNKILIFEKERKIRADFLDFYLACVKPSDSPFRRNYFSRSKHYYLHQIEIWEDLAKKYDPHQKIIHRGDKSLEDADAVSDIFTIIDGIRTVLPYIFTSFSAIAVYVRVNEFVTIFFLGLSIILVIFGWCIEILKIDSQAIHKLNNDLVISHQSVYLKNGCLPEKENLIGPYVWNRSLCNYSTIPNFVFLLMIKLIVPKIYERIKRSMIRTLPKYMPIFVQNQSRLKFAIFIMQNRHLLKK